VPLDVLYARAHSRWIHVTAALTEGTSALGAVALRLEVLWFAVSFITGVRAARSR